MVKIRLIPVGLVDLKILKYIKEGLEDIIGFPVIITKELIPLPKEAYNPLRKQYNSTYILKLISSISHLKGYQKVLGIVDVDAYVSGLNFVFGEAILGGNAAVIYLARLRQEFYDLPPDQNIFLLRTLKEALHELGHTFGLTHCPNPLCVMHFSNSILDTDRKLAKYCAKCSQKLRSMF